MSAEHEDQAQQRSATLPGELAAALRAHPYWVTSSIALAWLVALVVSFTTPTQFEADLTVQIGRVGVVEAVQRNDAVRWTTTSHALEDPGALAGRLFGERAAQGAEVRNGDMPPVIYGVRIEELGGRNLLVIARAGSAQAAQSFLEAVAQRVLAEHAQRLAQARALQEEARAALASRIEMLQHAVDAATPNTGSGLQLAQEIALLTALELQLQQASGPSMTQPSRTRSVDSDDSVPVAPRTGRNFAVASIAGLFAGMAIAVFLRALRNPGA